MMNSVSTHLLDICYASAYFCQKRTKKRRTPHVRVTPNRRGCKCCITQAFRARWKLSYCDQLQTDVTCVLLVRESDGWGRLRQKIKRSKDRKHGEELADWWWPMSSEFLSVWLWLEAELMYHCPLEMMHCAHTPTRRPPQEEMKAICRLSLLLKRDNADPRDNGSVFVTWGQM